MEAAGSPTVVVEADDRHRSCQLVLQTFQERRGLVGRRVVDDDYRAGLRRTGLERPQHAFEECGPGPGDHDRHYLVTHAADPSWWPGSAGFDRLNHRMARDRGLDG